MSLEFSRSLLGAFERADAIVARHMAAGIDAALRKRIAEIEGEIPPLEEIARHARCIACAPVDEQPFRAYTWRGVPIVEVRRDPDPLRYGYIITELRPA